MLIDPASIGFQVAALIPAVQAFSAQREQALRVSMPPVVLKVLEAIPFAPARITRPEVELATGIPTGSVRESMSQLRRRGLISGTERTGNRLCFYWRVGK